jgi:YD repeat-containing protein
MLARMKNETRLFNLSIPLIALLAVCGLRGSVHGQSRPGGTYACKAIEGIDGAYPEHPDPNCRGSGGPTGDPQPQPPSDCGCDKPNTTNGTPTFPTSSSGGSGRGSGCSSCRPGGPNANPAINPGEVCSNPAVARNVTRVWISTQPTQQSSFSPTFYSEFDSQLAIFPEANNSVSVTYLNVRDVTRRFSFLLVDGLNGDTRDGIFYDQRNASILKMEMRNSAGTLVTIAAQAAEFTITHLNGEKESFGLIDLDASPTVTAYAGRLTKRTDPQGKELVINYRTWTQAEIDASPDRQWQINTISDAFGNSLALTYGATQQSGRWSVTGITRNDGMAASVQYASGKIASVTYDDGSQAVYTHTYDEFANANLVTVVDPMSRPMDGKYYLAIDFAGNTTANPPTLNLQVPGEIYRRNNLQGEAAWERKLPSNTALDEQIINIAGNMTVVYGDGTRRLATAVTGGSGAINPQPAVYSPGDVTLDPVTFGSTAAWAQIQKSQLPNAKSAGGRQITMSYDSAGNITTLTYVADSSFATGTFNAFSKPTRLRNRNGNVTLNTYDAQGRLLTKATGLKEQNGSDVQTAEYAIETNAYYTTGPSTGFLQTQFSPLYSSAQPTLYRTDYEYSTKGLVTKVTGAATATGQPRPVTILTYDAKGMVATVTDPETRVTQYSYDAMGRSTQTLYPDGSTDQTLYGVATGPDAGRPIKTKTRDNVVTTYSYDASGRLTTTVAGAATDANILDGNPDDNLITDVNLKTTTVITYKTGSNSIRTKVTVNGVATDYVYDALNRLVEVKQYPRTGKTLSSKKAYENHLVLYDEDPYGRRKYYGYRASDETLIRTVTATVPEYTLANFAAVWALVRNSGSNATYIVNDAIRDTQGQLTQIIDGRGVENRMEYDSRGREINKRVAFGTAIEARTETLYNAASNVIEVRSPRYFDSADTNGSTKAREQWTYNGLGQVATHTEAPGTTEAATESFTYDLGGHQATRTDFGGNVWTRIEDSCCDKQNASVDPLGHGTITNTDSMKRTSHTIQVSDVTTHVGLFANPTDAKTLSESTTKFDSAGRPIYQTSWLTPRGLVDPANPPIAGLNGVPITDGLTTQYLYDNNLTDGVGLDNATGVSALKLGTGGTGSTRFPFGSHCQTGWYPSHRRSWNHFFSHRSWPSNCHDQFRRRDQLLHQRCHWQVCDEW